MPHLGRRALIGAAAAAFAAPAPVLAAISAGRTVADVAREGLARHARSIRHDDLVGVADFSQPSKAARFWLVDMQSGRTTAHLVSHGRGSDPSHTGYAKDFSDIRESHMSSVGAFVTAGASWGSQQGPNVLLDGLEYSNNLARDRAIIIHGADYADPGFLAREGKLGRSYGCFSVAHADLPALRERMGTGRLLFAYT